ncbi:Ku protein [Longimicrobium sp.]|uniref:non-homologous end joining protein Ku n=1 Tax=Longimicrobium sp. TaxID=2029185 RepID=UPI002C966034|nr:Ku protein [Longimicrobium sp.]HSU18053.1 Ku protein [Longimicrobium sp.]
MARAIWKGSISFGLVSIPVGLFSAESPDEIHFRQLDKRNLAPVGYKKYNKETGDEVSMDEIVKGYEYEDDRYVLISDEDLRRANPEKTQTVDITDFVDLDEIDPEYFDKPYYLAPTNKKNMKAYALLREALKRARKVGIAKVVIRSREYLSAVIPHRDVLVLEILRYPHEIRGTGELELPGEDLEGMGVTDREVKMAEMLIDGMTAEFDPAKYHDTYRDDLMGLIHKKIESGQTEVLDETPVEAPEPRGDVIDIMALLKKSVEATQRQRVAADTASNSADDDEDDDAEEKKPGRAAKKSTAKSSAKKAAKPKSAEPAKPRARARKSA